MSATAAATDAPEMVLVPYDDFFAAYRFVPRSRMFPNDCLKTRLRSLLASEDVAHADEAEAIADRQAREEARDGGGWRTIDSAPREWVDVLLFVPKLRCDHRKVCEGWYDENKGEWRSAAFGRVRPTHWRPLPAAPAIEPSPVEGDRR